MTAPARRRRERRLVLHGGQELVRSSNARITVAPSGRRWGKSHAGIVRMATRAYQAALRREEGVRWVIGPTYKILRTLWRKWFQIIPAEWITHTYGTERAPDTIFIGGQRVEFRSGDNPETLVAEGLSDVWIDEAGVMKSNVWTESVRPMLLDHDADALLTGTPKGRNFFYNLHIRGQDPSDQTVFSHRGSTYENPFLKPELIAELRGDMPDRTYRQEILAEFLTDEGAVFRNTRLCVYQTDGKYSREPVHSYGLDLAKHQDYTVIYALDKNGWTVGFERWVGLNWDLQEAKIAAYVGRNPRAPVTMDSTGVGDVMYDKLRKRIKNPITPYLFSPASKERLIEALAVATQEVELGLPDEPVIINELEAFEYELLRSGRARYQAPEGLHDDIVIALALAWWGMSERRRMSIPGSDGRIVTELGS